MAASAPRLADLPDAVLAHLFERYLVDHADLLAVRATCKRFAAILLVYGVWHRRATRLPILASDNSTERTNTSTNKNKSHRIADPSLPLRIANYLNISSSSSSSPSREPIVRVLYRFNKKMMPQVQLNGEHGLLWTDGAELKHAEWPTHRPLKVTNLLSCGQPLGGTGTGEDVRGFVKKDGTLVAFGTQQLVATSVDEDNNNNNNDQQQLVNRREWRYSEPYTRINCVDFSAANNLLVHGTSTGRLRINDLRGEQATTSAEIRVNDRILRCHLAPSATRLAIGTAGVGGGGSSSHPFQRLPEYSTPLGVYDTERLVQVSALKASPGGAEYRYGAGILALQFLDESLLISAGYDTFIRVHDLRAASACVQTLEEPDDMSVVCLSAASSEWSGVLSGTDRFGQIRYWDRRANRIVKSFRACRTNSPVYSLACSTDAIYAACDTSISAIRFHNGAR